MARPRLHDENLRLRLLANAGRLVTECGVDGLSLRALAAQTSTSTTAVYALFGGKTGLLGALFDESFDSFGTAQRAVSITGDTVSDLAALGRAYWEWSLENPHLYGVMFGSALAGIERTPAQGAKAAATMQPLAGVVSAGVESGVLVGDPSTITFAVWAAVHGVVSLALADCLPPERAVQLQLFTATAEAIVRGWQRPG
jgi:AcrR family transcriptional regulator